MGDDTLQQKCLPLCGKNNKQQPHRTVFINSGHPHNGYDGNRTATTKYNVVTFLPKALFEQYRRIANVYFTLTAALSLTAWSPVRPWTLFAPLVLVIGLSIVKEAYEDWKRYRADTEVNNRKVRRLNQDTKEFEVTTWQKLRVGDIVEVLRDEFFPADLLLLSADNDEGICYIETMNLDGETNLKIKKCLDETKGVNEITAKNFTATLVCEAPNSRLYQFVGNLKVGDAQDAALNPSCILLRGCSLRNTNRVFGAIIYAGHETKVFKNSSKPPSKRSKIERMVDKVILFMFALLFAMCISGAICMAVWTEKSYANRWYLDPLKKNVQWDPGHPWQVGSISFLTSFMLYGYLIPISLYVSIEIVKLAQALFINQDIAMWHADSDTPALARTSNLNEELGMVNTILTDKTGTLTRNVMEFFKCSIAGVEFGAGITEIERANAARQGRKLAENPGGNAQYKERFFNFFDHRLMGTSWTTQPGAKVIEDFFRLLAVCHTVIPEGPPDPKLIKYEAESPDESALVVAAKVFGFFCFKRSNTTITVRETTASGTEDVEYEILNILEFNSTRKRMSVIFRGPDDKLKILCKGADTVIYERLDPNNQQNKELSEVTRQHMERFGSAGLRTLCLAQADIDPQFYDEWQQKFIKAKVSLENREERLSEVSEEIERNLVLLGCTAIEDKLQEGVPACIRKLADAGIRIWVLTGDKMETAVNVGYACQLITDEMQQFRVSGSFPEVEALEAGGRLPEAHEVAGKLVEARLRVVDSKIPKDKSSLLTALIIDGKALTVALDKKSPERRTLLLKVGLQCKAVVCCRVSPLQKALVTHLVKSHGDITLAIGDGANDVGMIQKAHIGVGISGQEGMQAVLSADFAIAQFRFLERLLLVHGRWSYKRISRMVVFFFYKNLVLGTTIFTYNALALFSGSTIYNDLYMSMYNVVFTALTPVIIGIFDRDVDAETSLKYPALYLAGQRNQNFNLKVIAAWFVSAFYQCAMAFSLVMYGTRPLSANRENGHIWGKDETGLLLFSVVILTVHLQISTVLDQWTVFHHVAIWGSIFVWWLFMICYGALPLYFSLDLHDLFLGIAAGSPQYWLFLALIPIACVLPDFFIRYTLRTHQPEIHHLVQAQELRGQKGSSLTSMENGSQHEMKSLGSSPKRELERQNTEVELTADAVGYGHSAKYSLLHPDHILQHLLPSLSSLKDSQLHVGLSDPEKSDSYFSTGIMAPPMQLASTCLPGSMIPSTDASNSSASNSPDAVMVEVLLSPFPSPALDLLDSITAPGYGQHCSTKLCNTDAGHTHSAPPRHMDIARSTQSTADEASSEDVETRNAASSQPYSNIVAASPNGDQNCVPATSCSTTSSVYGSAHSSADEDPEPSGYTQPFDTASHLLQAASCTPSRLPPDSHEQAETTNAAVLKRSPSRLSAGSSFRRRVSSSHPIVNAPALLASGSARFSDLSTPSPSCIYEQDLLPWDVVQNCDSNLLFSDSFDTEVEAGSFTDKLAPGWATPQPAASMCCPEVQDVWLTP